MTKQAEKGENLEIQSLLFESTQIIQTIKELNPDFVIQNCSILQNLDLTKKLNTSYAVPEQMKKAIQQLNFWLKQVVFLSKNNSNVTEDFRIAASKIEKILDGQLIETEAVLAGVGDSHQFRVKDSSVRLEKIEPRKDSAMIGVIEYKIDDLKDK